MLRRALAILALVAPAVLVWAAPGCGDEPLPQDLCSWLADDNNCYNRFADDVGAQCGRDFVAGSDPLTNATGSFLARDDLSLCIRDLGGQVIFDPPLDVTTFPLTSVGFKILDERGTECGSGSVSGPRTYSVTIAAVSKDDAGASGPLDDDITGGTFSSEQPAERDVLNVSCPGGQETHNFNTLVVDKCAGLAGFLPRAVLDSSPGTPPYAGNAATPGFARLRVEYPADDPNASGALPRVVEYFDCLIPAPPPPCQDGIRNGTETDLDCGGSGGCPGCAQGQHCVENGDCLSDNCGLNAGIKQCL